ncbi:hypothetical protein LMG24235_06685 [Paraburkholderia sabiae]|nr:hypothetical protein LMG24235_06685 [Paraburkholderia sabiae]
MIIRARYAVGVWPSLWPSEPQMSHRILIDLSLKRVVAGQDRVQKQWRTMNAADFDYMQQIIGESFQDVFDDPHEYGLDLVDEPPPWAREGIPGRADRIKGNA